MSRITKSRTLAAMMGAPLLALAATAVTVAPAQAVERASVGLSASEIAACLAPLGARSPDVLQGWLDGCRTIKLHAYSGNDPLRNYV